MYILNAIALCNVWYYSYCICLIIVKMNSLRIAKYYNRPEWHVYNNILSSIYTFKLLERSWFIFLHNFNIWNICSYLIFCQDIEIYIFIITIRSLSMHVVDISNPIKNMDMQICHIHFYAFHSLRISVKAKCKWNHYVSQFYLLIPEL